MNQSSLPTSNGMVPHDVLQQYDFYFSMEEWCSFIKEDEDSIHNTKYRSWQLRYKWMKGRRPVTNDVLPNATAGDRTSTSTQRGSLDHMHLFGCIHFYSFSISCWEAQ